MTVLGLKLSRISPKGVNTALYVRVSLDPTIIDDADDGYEIGKRWINEATGEEFVLVDNTPGAAIWLSTTSGTGGGGGVGGSGTAGQAAFWVNSTTLTGRRIKSSDVDSVASTLAYDGEGRLSVVTTAYGTKTLNYDVNGRLSSITGTGVYQSKTFIYDVGGNLTGVSIP